MWLTPLIKIEKYLSIFIVRKLVIFPERLLLTTWNFRLTWLSFNETWVTGDIYNQLQCKMLCRVTFQSRLTKSRNRSNVSIVTRLRYRVARNRSLPGPDRVPPRERRRPRALGAGQDVDGTKRTQPRARFNWLIYGRWGGGGGREEVSPGARKKKTINLTTNYLSGLIDFRAEKPLNRTRNRARTDAPTAMSIPTSRWNVRGGERAGSRGMEGDEHGRKIKNKKIKKSTKKKPLNSEFVPTRSKTIRTGGRPQKRDHCSAHQKLHRNNVNADNGDG